MVFTPVVSISDICSAIVSLAAHHDGVPEKEMLVTLDPQRAAASGVTADEVSAAISAADRKGQAGWICSARGEMILNLSGRDRKPGPRA